MIFFDFIYLLLNVRVKTINVNQTTIKQQRIINNFNRKKSKFIILIIIYVITFINLNFQYNCFKIYIFEIVVDLNILKQTIKRITRLNNLNKIVYLYKYIIKNTFNNKIIARNINKIIFQTIIELNCSIFYNDKKNY